MNTSPQLADTEHLLEDVSSMQDDQGDAGPRQQPTPDGRQLVRDLDQAQILKAAAYLSPARFARG